MSSEWMLWVNNRWSRKLCENFHIFWLQEKFRKLMRDWSVLRSFVRLERENENWSETNDDLEWKLFNDFKVEDCRSLKWISWNIYSKEERKFLLNWLRSALHFMAWDCIHMWTSDDDKMRYILNPNTHHNIFDDTFPLWWLR